MTENTFEKMPAVMPPVAFNASFYNQPDLSTAILDHNIQSSVHQFGLQAIICFDAQPNPIPSHLGLPQLDNDYSEQVFFQLSFPKMQFGLFTKATKSTFLQMTLSEYLCLLQFISTEWGRVKSKLLTQMDVMNQGQDPVTLTSHLFFYNHGFSYFKISLSERLLLKAKMDSKTQPVKSPAADQAVFSKEGFKVWLEMTTNETSEMVLPIDALVELAHHQLSIKMLMEFWTAYKSRQWKRLKTV